MARKVVLVFSTLTCRKDETGSDDHLGCTNAKITGYTLF